MGAQRRSSQGRCLSRQRHARTFRPRAGWRRRPARQLPWPRSGRRQSRRGVRPHGRRQPVSLGPHERGNRPGTSDRPATADRAAAGNRAGTADRAQAADRYSAGFGGRDNGFQGVGNGAGTQNNTNRGSSSMQSSGFNRGGGGYSGARAAVAAVSVAAAAAVDVDKRRQP
jgi:hypothetical protein